MPHSCQVSFPSPLSFMSYDVLPVRRTRIFGSGSVVFPPPRLSLVISPPHHLTNLKPHELTSPPKPSFLPLPPPNPFTSYIPTPITTITTTINGSTFTRYRHRYTLLSFVSKHLQPLSFQSPCHHQFHPVNLSYFNPPLASLASSQHNTQHPHDFLSRFPNYTHIQNHK